LKSILSVVVIVASLLMFGNAARAAEQTPFHNGLSLQGFTGILNTPSAHVTREGDIYALYSNQKDVEFRNKGSRVSPKVFCLCILPLSPASLLHCLPVCLISEPFDRDKTDEGDNT
jgi:hypothetical protein